MEPALRASLKGKGWCDRLMWVMLEIRTMPKKDLQSSAMELVYGDYIPHNQCPCFVKSQLSAHLDTTGALVPVPTEHGLP
jgi:hypothetical protein